MEKLRRKAIRAVAAAHGDNRLDAVVAAEYLQQIASATAKEVLWSFVWELS